MIDHPELLSKTDVNHLGVLIGNSDSARIIAVSTSMVFDDRTLSRTFWGIENTAMDSGFQGHMYTRPNDILTVCVPCSDQDVPDKVKTAVGVNHAIWKSLTGIRLLPKTGHVILATAQPVPATNHLPLNYIWYSGSLPEAAVSRWQDRRETLFAFVLNCRLTDQLGLHGPENTALLIQAQNTSMLMDKNAAMQVLQENGVDCAKTYLFNENTDLKPVFNYIPQDEVYVFKPAGGAAGIGIFSNNGHGARLDRLQIHMDRLQHNSQLPERFQIQQFVAGTPYGVTGFFNPDGTFEIFEIHEQLIDHTEGFVGARWTPYLQAEQMESARKLYKQLSAIRRPCFRGLIALDIIAGKIIEVNPRLTAAAPIAHLLRRHIQIPGTFESNLQINQIDLNTEVLIPFELIKDRTLIRIIERIWQEQKVLVLPQGLNPFGKSRLIFVNDDPEGTAQQLFIREIAS